MGIIDKMEFVMEIWRIVMKKRVFTTLIIILTLIFTGCSSGNPDENESLAQDATKNFDIIVSNNIENKIFHDELNHFGLVLKDGEKFEWTGDPSANEADFSLSFNADEFIAAGLDVTKLEGTSFSYQGVSESYPGMIVYTSDVSNEKETYNDYKEAFEKLLDKMPGQLSILENDGYILDIGLGFQVHWNGEERENKDIAFIINADDLIEAGLNVEKLSSWKIMKNTDTNDTQVKLFKVYYLK